MSRSGNVEQLYGSVAKRMHTNRVWEFMEDPFLSTDSKCTLRSIAQDDAADETRCNAKVRVQRAVGKDSPCLERRCKLPKGDRPSFCYVHQKRLEQIGGDRIDEILYKRPTEGASTMDKEAFDSEWSEQMTIEAVVDRAQQQQNDLISKMHASLKSFEAQYGERITDMAHMNRYIQTVTGVKLQLERETARQTQAIKLNEANIQKLVADAKQNGETIATLENERTELKRLQQDIQTKLKGIEETVKQLQIEKTNLEANLTVRVSNITNLEEELENVTSQLQTEQESAATLRENLVEVSQKVTEQESNLLEKGKELVDINQTVETLKTSIQANETQIASLNEEKQLETQKLEQLQEFIAAYQTSSYAGLSSPFNELGIDTLDRYECLRWLEDLSRVLGPHQRRAARRFIDQTSSTTNNTGSRMLLLHNTGMGKTYVAMAIARCMYEMKKIDNVVFFVHVPKSSQSRASTSAGQQTAKTTQVDAVQQNILKNWDQMADAVKKMRQTDPDIKQGNENATQLPGLYIATITDMKNSEENITLIYPTPNQNTPYPLDITDSKTLCVFDEMDALFKGSPNTTKRVKDGTWLINYIQNRPKWHCLGMTATPYVPVRVQASPYNDRNSKAKAELEKVKTSNMIQRMAEVLHIPLINTKKEDTKNIERFIEAYSDYIDVQFSLPNNPTDYDYASFEKGILFSKEKNNNDILEYIKGGIGTILLADGKNKNQRPYTNKLMIYVSGADRKQLWENLENEQPVK